MSNEDISKELLEIVRPYIKSTRFEQGYPQFKKTLSPKDADFIFKNLFDLIRELQVKVA